MRKLKVLWTPELETELSPKPYWDASGKLVHPGDKDYVYNTELNEILERELNGTNISKN